MKNESRNKQELSDESPFKAKRYTVVKQWSFEDSKFKRVARPDIYRSSMVRPRSRPPSRPSSRRFHFD